MRSFVISGLSFLLLILCFTEISECSANTIDHAEYIINGSFDADDTGWGISGSLSYITQEANYQGAGWGMSLAPTQSENYWAYTAQPLFTPSVIKQIDVAFDYRFMSVGYNPGFSQSGAGIFAQAAPLDSPLVQVHFNNDANRVSASWDAINYSLTPADIATLSQHVQNGGRLYFIIYAVASDLAMHIDNVSCRISGEIMTPDTLGTITYLHGDNDFNEIRLVEPDGSNDRSVWRIESEFSKMFDVAWRPDASEIAFTSNHEFHQSIYSSDIFAIRPDGSGLRRITNFPSINNLPADTPTGTVEGTVYNSNNEYYAAMLIIHGAPEPVSIQLAPNDYTTFRVENVMDFGIGVFQSIAVLSDSYREIAATVLDVVAGETVADVQVIYYRNSSHFEPRNLTWSSDGSVIGFSMDGLFRKITPDPVEYTISQDVFSQLGEHISMNAQAWSPVDDWILYEKFLKGIYRIKDNSTTVGEEVFYSMNASNPTWLPDASGLIYTELDQQAVKMKRYDFDNSSSSDIFTLFNEYFGPMSVSWPNGNYTVYTRYSKTYSTSNLWVVSNQNPAIQWPLTNSIQNGNPDWSRIDISDQTAVTDWSLY